MEDSKIIELYFARDEAAIEQTRTAYGAKLRAVARCILADERDAEECENDTYLKAWNSIPPACPAHFLGYIIRICRNTALNMLEYQNAAKRSACLVELTEEMQACIPDSAQGQAIEAEEMGHVLSRFLRQQKADDRVIFVRRYLLLEPVAQVAAALGCSEGRVRTSLSRMRARFRSYLKREGVKNAGSQSH